MKSINHCQQMPFVNMCQTFYCSKKTYNHNMAFYITICFLQISHQLGQGCEGLPCQIFGGGTFYLRKSRRFLLDSESSFILDTSVVKSQTPFAKMFYHRQIRWQILDSSSTGIFSQTHQDVLSQKETYLVVLSQTAWCFFSDNLVVLSQTVLRFPDPM